MQNKVFLCPAPNEYGAGSAHKVIFGGKICAPDFNSKGAANIYLGMLESGKRKPEYESADEK